MVVAYVTRSLESVTTLKFFTNQEPLEVHAWWVECSVYNSASPFEKDKKTTHTYNDDATSTETEEAYHEASIEIEL